MTTRIIPTVLLAVLLAGCGKREEKEVSAPKAPAVAVAVTEVAVQPLWDEEEVVGSVEAAQRAVLSAKVTGVIDSLKVAPGARVTKHTPGRPDSSVPSSMRADPASQGRL